MAKKRRRVKAAKDRGFEVINPECSAIDLGSRVHVVALPPRGDEEPELMTIGTTTDDYEQLAKVLRERGVKSVAMESTGVYWVALFEYLEGAGFHCLLTDTRDKARVPGRKKSDAIDSTWALKLHSCGLLTGAFRPEDEVVKLRTLVREKATLIGERADWVRRIQKVLTEMNVKVHHAVTDITGQTGMRIIRAIVEGERDPKVLASMRDEHCKKSEEQIAKELRGNWREEHLFCLKQGLDIYDKITEIIHRYENEIAERVSEMERDDLSGTEIPPPTKPMDKEENAQREALYRMCGVDLTRIPGINIGVVEVLLSEIGPDLSSFPNEKAFASYLKLTPNVSTSAGKFTKKKRSATTTRTANALRNAAASLERSSTALGSHFRRIKARKGPAAATFSTAQKLAIFAYRSLRYGAQYIDEGVEAYEARFRERRLRSCKQIAKELGYALVDQSTLDAATP